MHQQTQQQTFCPNCRGGNPPQAQFCSRCGAALSGAPHRDPSLRTYPAGALPQPTYVDSPDNEELVDYQRAVARSNKGRTSIILFVAVIALAIIGIGMLRKSALEGPSSPPPPPTAVYSLPDVGSGANSDASAVSVSVSEQAYAAALVGWTQSWPAAFTELSNLTNAPDPTNPTWKAQVAVQLIIIEAVDKAVIETSAPPRFVAVQSKLKLAAQYYDRFATDLAKGVDQSNATLLNQAALEESEGTSLLQQATADLQKLSP